MMTRLKKAILSNPGSIDENLKILHMQRLDKIRVKIADKEDPREKGIYRYDETKNEFVEVTGKSNYIRELQPEEFFEALMKYNYSITVSEAV